MHQRRSQGDSKSTSSTSGSLSSMSTTNNASSTSTTGRVSIYSMREKVILNKMTKMMGKLAPNTETEVTSRLHQEIPAIRLDGHLTYCLYSTLQNILHLSAIYIVLYHTVFWLDSNNFNKEILTSSRILEQTKYEHTHFITLTNRYYARTGTSVNIDLIDKYIYVGLLGISLVELISAFLWTFKKKLPVLVPRNQKLRQRTSRLLSVMIVFVYFGFIAWLILHTFITHQLSKTFFSLIFGHLIILTLLDKPNLFQNSSDNSSKQSTVSRKQNRNSTSSSSTSSIATSVVGRPSSYRSSTNTQPRKVNPIVTTSSSSSTEIPSSRWSSITEQKIGVHECSTFYEQARQEANDLWSLFNRRIILNLYRTLTSFILFDFIPIKMMGNNVRSTDNQPLKLLILIFTLSTFITHSAFLFPVKLQTALHRIATHLGQWRSQSSIRTDTIHEWSSECNSYTRGSVVKLSSNNRYFVATEHLSNAAHPQSKAHAIIYRFFGDATYFINIQIVFCIILTILQFIWIIRSKYWEQILISWLITFYSSYPIFKITRDRIILNLVEYQDDVQTTTTLKQKRSS
ncbi:unnamed protein product [Adineta steineri]|uniref:Uncharacterized protein n=1 Tax=Adineta steineri TaxID=433720 RepID=A0A818VIH3_9BILA|nr:unnamed protein product [Adineta steineri]CAF3707634.1 unnamed protein product [Adineta steineri]